MRHPSLVEGEEGTKKVSAPELSPRHCTHRVCAHVPFVAGGGGGEGGGEGDGGAEGGDAGGGGGGGGGGGVSVAGVSGGEK